MSKLILILAAGLAFNTACSKSNSQAAPPPADSVHQPAVSFTDKDATAALNNFNDYFYNPAEQLYYATTEKNSTGAIWTQAIFWDMVMNAYKRTSDPALLQKIKDIYQGGYKKYDRYNWSNKTVWFIYDDMMWWIISLARAYEITKDSAYLDAAVAGFQHVWEGAYDAAGGGMWWDFNHSGKNACINFPTVIGALQLYKVTGNSAYLQKAKDVYSWALANLTDAGTGRVADNNINGKKGWSDYTYNQGTFIGAAAMLYKATGESAYLDQAKLGADYTQKSMCDKDGILPAEGDWNEQGVLKAILGHYLLMLVQDADQPQYLPWIRKNINTAWGNRDAARGLTYRNYKVLCPKGNIQSYEASSAVMFMQVCPPEK